MNKRPLKIAAVIAGLLMAAGALTACTGSAATPLGSCAYVLGDGQSGRDASIKRLSWPGGNAKVASDEIAQYVACSPRNYIVNDGKRKNAAGETIGDLTTPFIAKTKDGTEVYVQLRLDWILNQSAEGLTEFYPFCHKFTCYDTTSDGGEQNSATPGWNKMLGETFPDALKPLVEGAIGEATDAIWKTKDVTENEAAATYIANNFADKVRPMTGASVDLFCGTGNSEWVDPLKVGEDGEWKCGNVFVTITDVKPVNEEVSNTDQEQSLAEQQKAANTAIREAAEERYGSDAGYWLGIQDSIEKCKESVTCVINLGNGSVSPLVGSPATPTE